MSEDHILNPLFPFTAFPVDSNDGTIAFGLVYELDDRYIPESANASAHLNSVCVKCKTELHLDYLESFSSCGRDGLAIRKSDILRIYEIVSWFLQRGHRIYMQDGTQVTFSLADSHQVNLIRQQQILLDSCRKLLLNKLPLTLVNLPIHRSAFWQLEQGKQFAQEVRNQFNLVDYYPPPEQGMYIGELLQWQAEQKISEHKDPDSNAKPDEKASKDSQTSQAAQDSQALHASQESHALKASQESHALHASQDSQVLQASQESQAQQLCVVCLDKEANTFCLPCEHCVVCAKCSIALRSDEINKTTCVYCRQPIEHILE